MRSWEYEDAMGLGLIREGVQNGAVVEYVPMCQQYVVGERGWGPFKVSAEFVLDLEARFGAEIGWCFLRWATTQSRDRLTTSFYTVRTWDPEYLGIQ